MYYLLILVLLFLAELFYFRVADRYNIIDPYESDFTRWWDYFLFRSVGLFPDEWL